MDYTQQIENVKQQLFSLGFTEEKYEELLSLAIEEIMDTALADLQDKELELLEELEKNLVAEPTTIEEATKNIELIFSAAYGDQAEETRQRMLLEYLNETLQQTKATRDLLQRYQAGDPTAIATIEANKNTPEAIAVANYLEEQQTIEEIDKIAKEVVEEGWRESQIAAQQQQQQSNSNVTSVSGVTENTTPAPEPFPQPTTM